MWHQAQWEHLKKIIKETRPPPPELHSLVSPLSSPSAYVCDVSVEGVEVCPLEVVSWLLCVCVLSNTWREVAVCVGICGVGVECHHIAPLPRDDREQAGSVLTLRNHPARVRKLP